ncbi:TIGR00282 family metallophosphoesterase [Patescibacteria group bacterium]
MKILFIGDIVGKPGRKTVKEFLPDIKQEHQPDLILANGENVTHGRGISDETVKELQGYGIDYFTSGNHIFANKTVVPKLDDKSFPVIRPANFPPGNPGRGYHIYETAKMQKILIINLMGRVFMNQNYDCPFRTTDAILEETKGDQPAAVIVDIHAEATSEKIALGHYLDGRVSAVIGTHTHIPTADAKILEKGTAYITDVGMVGTEDSAIGADKKPIIQGFLTQMPFKYEIADGPSTFNAVLLEIDDSSGKATNIEQIIKRYDNT